MRDQERLTWPVTVSLRAEIEIANAEHVGQQLRGAFAPGVSAVIAEMGLTVFCCIFGSRQLVAVHKSRARNRVLPSPKSCEAKERRPIVGPPPCAGCRPMSPLYGRGF